MIVYPKFVINIRLFSKTDGIEKIFDSFIDIEKNHLNKKLNRLSNLILIFIILKIFLIPSIKSLLNRDFCIKNKNLLNHSP